VPTERTVLVRLKADVSGFNRGLAEAATGVNTLRKEINTTNERTAWLTQGILAIAPAVVPLGAAAVPVFAGMAAQMTVAGVAAGTLALGFHGIGTAVTALNKYQLEPTAANLQAMQEAMAKVGPEGQQFVEFLDSLGPQLNDLSNAARAGMFPGMEEGITHLMTLLPRVKLIVSQVADGLGQLSAEAGSNLAGPKFREFFDFLETDAKPILIEMGHTVGNLADGLAALFVALLPEAKGFTSGLEEASAAFAKWAHSLDGTEGFQHFLDYVNQSGPQTRAFLEALGKTFVALIEAAAPVGSVLLPIFTQLLNILSAIAATPFGSTLIAFGSLISLYGRFAAIGSNLVGGGFGRGFTEQTKAIKAGIPTYREFGNAALHSMHSVSQLNEYFADGAEKAIKSRAAVAGWMRSVAPMAGQAALLGVMMTGADKKMGLTNTTSLALAGSLAGPYGAAVGGAIGFTMDLAHANDSLSESVKRANAAVNSADYGSAVAAMADLQAQTDKSSKAIHDAWSIDEVGSFKGSMTAISDMFTHANAEARKQLDDLTMEQFNTQSALLSIGSGLGAPNTDIGEAFFPNSTKGIAELTDIANRAQPAMQALGISFDDLRSAADEGGGSLAGLTDQIVAWIQRSDSAAGRTAAVGGALHGLDTQMLSTEQSASNLSQAMNALFGPKLGVNAAHNAWLESLRALKGQLDANSHAVLGNSNAALKNQDAIRGVVNNSLSYLQAMAANGAGSKRVTAAYQSQRAALIQTAGQLGINRGAMVQLLRQYGLTPKAVTTIIKTAGAEQSLAAIRQIQAALAALRSKTITVTTQHVTGGSVKMGNADGGFIRGPGGPRDDLIPSWLSNGEFVVNAAATSRHLGLLHQINAQKFADGGAVGFSGAGAGSDGGVGDAAHKASDGLKRLSHSIDLAKKSIDDEKASRDRIRQDMQQIRSNVTGGFRSDFLGVDTGVWGQASDPFSILRGNIHDSRAYTKALRDLKKRGVHGQFAAQIDTLAAAQQVDALSNRQLHNLEHLFAVRQHASATAGQIDARVTDGRRLDEANKELREANRHLKVLEAEMRRHQKAAAHRAKATGDAVGAQINGSATRAVRRARR
jgi:hypothetical protein